MKLELKHLAPYLPYNMKYLFKVEDVYENSPNEVREKLLTYYSMSLCLKYGKPILRPLSELEQPEVFKIINASHGYPDFGHFERSVLWGHAEYELIVQLVSEHYDVFGLIEKGLAIDINTIENDK